MTAAHRLKGVGWFASCVVVVLGFYLVSLQVAAERGRLEVTERRIADAEHDIRALETEFETRANLTQLEKWNGDTLALTAPVASQFVTNEAALASIDVQAGPLAAAEGQPVRTAALVVPSFAGAPLGAPVAMTTAPSSAPALVQVAAVQPAAQMPKAAAVPEPALRPVVATTPAAKAALLRAVAVANVRPQAVAMLDDKLLSESTLGSIMSGARAESRRR